MSDQNKKERTSSVTITTESAREERETSLGALTPQEEKVVRMTHGLSEDDSRALQFALGADEETRMKLAMIERQLVDCISSHQEDEDVDRISPAELLASLLDGQ